MKFYLKEYNSRSQYISGYEEYPCIFLIHNTRNDYHFFSLFSCYYLESANSGQKDLGYIKIIQKGETNTLLPKEFDELEKDTYFSRAVNGKLYKKLDEELSEKKEDILKGLQDISFCGYNRAYIEGLKDETLIEGYERSLYRDDYSGISSTNSTDAENTITNILQLSTSIKDSFLHLLLYGSIITTLESYIGDTFKSEVMSSEKNIKRFLENYKSRNTENKLSLSDIYSNGDGILVKDFIKDYISKEMVQIIFHKLDLVQQLFKDILGIKVPKNIFSFSEDIQNRHDIFHRNGKRITGGELQIDNLVIQELGSRVLSFIKDMEESIMAQRKIS